MRTHARTSRFCSSGGIYAVSAPVLLILLTLGLGTRNVHAARQWDFISTPDPLGNVRLLADCLYNKNDLGEDCIPAYCQPSVTVHGDGVWLPRAPFAGTQWVTAIHSELFSEYTGWSFSFLELAATAGAVKGFTEVMGFFHWKANNTGSYHGLSPTYRQSADYGVLHATTDKSGKVTDVIIWRAGFMEEREVLASTSMSFLVFSFKFMYRNIYVY